MHRFRFLPLLLLAALPLACQEETFYAEPLPQRTTTPPLPRPAPSASGSPKVTVPIPGKWVPLEGVGDACIVRRAAEPAAIFPAVDWEPCAKESAECTRLRLTSRAGNFEMFGISAIQGVFVDDAGTHVVFSRSAQDGYLRTVHTLGQPASLAFYFDERQTCTAQATVTKEGISVFVHGGDGPFTHGLLTADLRDPSTLRFTDLSSRMRGFGGIGVRADRFVGYYTASSLALVGLDDNRASTRVKTGGIPLPVADGSVVPTELGDGFDFHSGTGAPARNVVTVSAGTNLVAMAADQDHGAYVAYVEAVTGVGGMHLFSMDLGPLAIKRAVASVPAFGASFVRAVTNAGLFAQTLREGGIRVVRLSDGYSWPVVLPNGHTAFRDLVRVDATSVWATAYQPGGGTAVERHLLVGEPTIPPE